MAKDSVLQEQHKGEQRYSFFAAAEREKNWLKEMKASHTYSMSNILTLIRELDYRREVQAKQGKKFTCFNNGNLKKTTNDIFNELNEMQDVIDNLSRFARLKNFNFGLAGEIITDQMTEQITEAIEKL